jgi:hypothetical protein
VAEVSDGQGDGPGEDEDADDNESGLVNVEVLDKGPEPSNEVVFLAGQAKDLDGADKERIASDLAEVRIGLRVAGLPWPSHRQLRSGG